MQTDGEHIRLASALGKAEGKVVELQSEATLLKRRAEDRGRQVGEIQILLRLEKERAEELEKQRLALMQIVQDMRTQLAEVMAEKDAAVLALQALTPSASQPQPELPGADGSSENSVPETPPDLVGEP